MKTTTQNTTITGRIETNEYTHDQLPECWQSMSDSERLKYLQDVDPVASDTTYNTTVAGMHEYFAINLDPTQTLQEEITHLALGDDDSTPATSDDSLNNEVFRKATTDNSQNQNNLTASTFIDYTEANGNTIREVGLFAGPDTSDRMWNHAVVSDIVKDSDRTITVDITLTFSAE